VLALKLRPGDLSIVLFADDARVVARLNEEVLVQELVRRALDTRCGGATNIAAALELGATELERGRNPRRSAVLISDGFFTAGADPRRAAARFRTLHVLLTQKAGEGVPDSAVTRGADASAMGGTTRRSGRWLNPERSAGRAMARAGGGRLIRVDGFGLLPRRMLELADHLLR
jgi:hypothetical protein